MLSKLFKLIGRIFIFLVFLVTIPITIPRLFGYTEYNVISGSMEPTLSIGSLVYVKECDFDDIQVGEIIVFTQQDVVITHRVVGVDLASRQFTTQGDANAIADFAPVPMTNVLGCVKGYIPMLGYAAEYATAGEGKFLAIAILLVGILLDFIGGRILHSAPSVAQAGVERKKRKPSVIFLLLGIAIIVGAGVGFYSVLNNYSSSNRLYSDIADTQIIEDAAAVDWQDMISVDFASLTVINPEVIGWLYVEGTDISYPIMYSGEDDKYLHTAVDGSQAKAGSIFLEGVNSIDFSDSHSIIYGHNMRNKSMFGSLKFFKTEDNYLQDHRYFQIITPDGKNRYEIFSYFDTPEESFVYTVPYSDSAEFADYISQLRRNSYETTDTSVDSSDKVVTLSTCSTTGMRFVVNAKLLQY